jgi:hypothetical protein
MKLKHLEIRRTMMMPVSLYLRTSKIVSLIISRKMSNMLSWWIVRVLTWHKERKSEYPHPLKERAARKLAESNVGRV